MAKDRPGNGLASLRGRIGGLALAAQRDPREHTSAARTAFLRRFEDQVDPEHKLPEAERVRRAAGARRLYFAQLHDGLAPFATGTPIYVGIDAIFGLNHLGTGDRRWQNEDYGTYTVATYKYPDRRGGKILVQPMEPYGPLNGERLVGELGWALVREAGIRTALIHLVLTAHTMDLANPTVDRFVITSAKLAEYLGYTGRGRCRGHRPLPAVLAEMEEMRLTSAWGITIRQVQIHREEERQGRPKRVPYIIRELEDRLWDIAVAREYQGYLADPEHGELRNIAWSVRPGQWNDSPNPFFSSLLNGRRPYLLTKTW